MFRKNTSGQFIHVQGVDSSTGGIKSGVTWTVRRCIDGTFAAATGTVTEDGTTGWYKFAMSQADTNGNNIGFNFTGTGAVPQTVNIVTDGSPPDVNLKNAAGTAVTLDANNVLNVSTKYVGGTLQTAGDIIGDTNDIQSRLPAALVGGRMDASVGAMAANVLTAAATAADFGAEIATAIWTDTTAGDFTVALSIGKSIMNGVALGTGLTINAYTGDTPQTGDSFVRIGVAGAGLTDLGGMSTTMKAQVESEATDALVAMFASSASLVTAIWSKDISGVFAAGTAAAYLASVNTWVAATGATGAGLTALAQASVCTEARLARLDAAVSTRATPAQVNAEVVDVISTDTPIDGKSIEAALEYIAAGVCGRVSGAGSGTEVFLGLDEATTRLTITVDSSGNRTDVTYG